LLLQQEGQLGDAEVTLQHALSIAEKTLGPEHPDVSLRLNNLAILYEDQGRVSEAEPLLKRALIVGEKKLGADHPNVTRIRENLGALYLSLRRPTDASPILRTALATEEKAYAINSPKLGYLFTQLGDLYRQEGLCAIADEFFREARSVGSDEISESKVYFVTDRERGCARSTTSFTSGRASDLTFGNVAVIVPTDALRVRTKHARWQEQLVSQRATNDPEATRAERMALGCIAIMPPNQFLSAVDEELGGAKDGPDKALVFVHGFNNNFENSLQRAGQLAYDMRFGGPVFAYIWPSEGRFSGYFTDADTVELATRHLEEFLLQVTKVRKSRSSTSWPTAWATWYCFKRLIALSAKIQTCAR
jgi:tetratricopeptide (TPR) repeat protein